MEHDMTPTTKRIVRESIPAVIVAIIVSIPCSALGMYASWELVKYRVVKLEERADKQDVKIDRQDETLNRIANDVAYLRGKAEAK